MKTGMSHTGQEITGLEYLEQRIQDAFIIQIGTLPLARSYGSNTQDLIDQNIDNDFKMQAYENAVDTFKNPANDLDDCEFKSMTIGVENDKVSFSVAVSFGGGIVSIKGLKYV